MCDTLVAIGNATADGSVILAKNSDRAPNEAQRLVYLPRARHERGSRVVCTYIEVPQVPETYEVVLSQPFWLWGAEMGANECGVAIGNEAVFTREPYEKGPALTGMDLLRLALERAATAREALEVITQLLVTYGQGGNCAFEQKMYYHNSFIIADPAEAWVLETAGRYWAAERVQSVRAISNALTIGREWDLASPGLVEHAIEKGWCRSREDFNFARCYSDPLMTWGAGGRPRQRRATELLTAHKGQITPATMMGFLRDHGAAGSDPRWHPSRGLRGTTLCMHALWGPLRSSQTAGSMVAHLTPGLQTFWLTGTSTPCTSLFKPVFLKGAGLPDIGPAASGSADPASLWWTHERLHRAVIEDYVGRLGLYRRERDELEGVFLAEAAELHARYRSVAPEERAAALAAFSASCFTRAAEATTRWYKAVTASPAKRSPLLFSLAWRSYSRRAGLR